MLAIRIKGTRSWLDPKSQPALASSLSARLRERMRGEEALFLTFTYRRDEWADPYDLYKEAARLKHLPRAMAKLEKHVGRSLAGKWIRKMEFQAGGWLHYHVILCGVRFIQNAELREIWGHGFVNVRRFDVDRHGGYFCKGEYFAKNGRWPAWLYLERPRSIKVISCSKGFWWDNEPGASGDEDEVKQDPPEVRRAMELDGLGRSMTSRLPIYKPIGQRIAECAGTVEVIDHREDAGVVEGYKPKLHRAEFKCCLGALVALCGSHNVVKEHKGWLVLDVDWMTLAGHGRRLEKEREAVELRRWEGPAAGREGPGDAAEPRRPLTRWSGEIVLEKAQEAMPWLRQYFMEYFADDYGACAAEAA